MLRVLFLVIALAAGGGAAWLALAMRGRPAVTTIVEAVTPAPAQEILVASADLGPGQMLAREHMRWQSWPESALNASYIGRSARPDALESLVGSIVRIRVIGGEPVREEKLILPSAGFLSAILPSGKRAVAVRISAENTAGGFILPNDRVDVINTVTSPGQGEGRKEHVSRTIISNIRVLAIDQSIDEKYRDEKGKDEKSKAKVVFIGKTATLELDPVQAEIVMAGEAMGTLSLALRSASDNGEVPPAARQLSSQTVRILRGGHTVAVAK